MSALRLPFSVYTAKYGYEWSSLPAGSAREDVDYFYKRAIELKPDFMEAGDVVQGVFAQNGCAVAFCVQIAREWDSNGRDAEYSAFAFLPFEEAAHVNFRILLEDPLFRVPNREPPSFLVYEGPESEAFVESPGQVELFRRGARLPDFDFEKIGALLATRGGVCESWLFSSVRAQGKTVSEMETTPLAGGPTPAAAQPNPLPTPQVPKADHSAALPKPPRPPVPRSPSPSLKFQIATAKTPKFEPLPLMFWGLGVLAALALVAALFRGCLSA